MRLDIYIHFADDRPLEASRKLEVIINDRPAMLEQNGQYGRHDEV